MSMIFGSACSICMCADSKVVMIIKVFKAVLTKRKVEILNVAETMSLLRYALFIATCLVLSNMDVLEHAFFNLFRHELGDVSILDPDSLASGPWSMSTFWLQNKHLTDKQFEHISTQPRELTNLLVSCGRQINDSRALVQTLSMDQTDEAAVLSLLHNFTNGRLQEDLYEWHKE